MSSFQFRKIAVVCAAVALGSTAASSFALTTFDLNIPAGATYGTVTLTQGVDSVAVHVDLADGYNFVDTGSHEAFGFNVAGAATITDLSPGTGYSATGGFTQSGFGDFTHGIACSSPPCQGGTNTSVPNDILDFNVNLAGITEASFVANAAGYVFTADLFGPNPTGGSLTFPVAAVPEPETYALLLAGLGVMGFIARRRKTQR